MNALIEEYLEVFTQDIGQITKYETNLKAKPGSNPRFFKARTLPYALTPKIEKNWIT